MQEPLATDWVATFWHAIGVAGALIFFGRFFLQWIASELRGRSVMPVAFWYMSMGGSLMLLAFGVYTQSPVGVLSYSFNMVVYTRNLVHIWRNRGGLSRRNSLLMHAFVGIVLMTALGLLAMTWLNTFHEHRSLGVSKAIIEWIWIFVGVFGQGLFALRFLLQWAVTERLKKSVIPNAFWFISVAASMMQMASYAHTGEWIYFAGLASTLIVYLRNIWLIMRHIAPETAAEA